MTCWSCYWWGEKDCYQHIPGFPDHNSITCPCFEYEPGTDEEEATNDE